MITNAKNCVPPLEIFPVLDTLVVIRLRKFLEISGPLPMSDSLKHQATITDPLITVPWKSIWRI